jgi:hypothetical protein
MQKRADENLGARNDFKDVHLGGMSEIGHKVDCRGLGEGLSGLKIV